MTGKFARAWERYRLPALLLLAFAIQFFRLGARTLHGDELGSLLEAAQLGLNANSLPYFALLHAWLALGDGEFWLRTLSAFAAVGAVAVTFAWTKRLCGAGLARRTSFLLATSPFLIVYGQQVRFYSFALFAASLSLWAFVFTMRRSGFRVWCIWLLSGFFAIAVLLLNGLLVLEQSLVAGGLSRWPRPRVKIGVAVVLLMACIAVIAIAPIRQAAFDALAVYMNAGSRYSISRGLALTQIAKIPLTLFFFVFGESVYPLTFALVIPGVLIFGAALLFGLVHLWSNRRAFWFILITAALALGMMYLVFDPLAPPTLQGAAPRYLIFLLPIFYLAAAAGAQGKTRWLILPLLLVNAASLMFYWYGDWAYTDDLIDWRVVTQWVNGYVTPISLVLPDGRAQDNADYYFPSTWTVENSWGSQNANDLGHLTDYARLIILSDDFHPDKRVSMSIFLQRVAERYNQTAVWSQYPLFIYVFDRKEESGGTGRLDLPTEIYGLEFQDVRLPLTANVAGRTLSITGAFGLPALDQQMTRALSLTLPTRARRIWLLSNVTGANIKTGAVVANLGVTADDGATQTIPLRAGFETSAWNAACQPSACMQAFTWRKRFALLGAERYPEAWQEFDASIFSAALNLNAPTTIRSLEFERATAEGVFYVWGIVLQP